MTCCTMTADVIIFLSVPSSKSPLGTSLHSEVLTTGEYDQIHHQMVTGEPENPPYWTKVCSLLDRVP